MILCVNANAAIDKTLVVHELTLGAIHRPEQVLAFPGGKGINAARALRRLGETPVVMGWVGGYAGRFIEEGLDAEGIKTALIHTPVESRTCLSVLDAKTGTMTEFYERGETIPPDQVSELKRQFELTVTNYQAVTFSGSLPPGVPADFYGQLLQIARAAGVRTLLDSSGEALRQGLTGNPTLVKPNRRELAELLYRDLSELGTVRAAARELAARYHVDVVVSLAGEGAIATNGSNLLHIRPPRVPAQSAVGSGDCMLAGLAYGRVRNFTLAESAKYGVAAGTANTLTLGAGNLKLEDFQTILAQITITEEN